MSAVIYALTANGGITVAKGSATALQSAVMLAERESATVLIDQANVVQDALKVEFPTVRWVFLAPDSKN